MALQRHNNTEAKKLDGDLKFLMDGENLASLIGLLQILDHYAWVSAEAQNVMKFPTTVFSRTCWTDNQRTGVGEINFPGYVKLA